jgi:hypothetical protein
MVPTPLQLIAAIQPDLYCTRAAIAQLRRSTTSEGLLAAAALATPRESNPVGTEYASLLDPFDLEGFDHPLARRCLVRDVPPDGIPSICTCLIDSLSVVCLRQATIEIIQENRCLGPGAWTSPVLLGDCAANAHIDAEILNPSSERTHTTESGDGLPPSPAAECRPLQAITFLVQYRYEPGDDVALGALPGEAPRAHRRAYYSVLLLELIIHGTPSGALNAEGGEGGRVELTVVTLSLNEDELRLLRRLVGQEAVAGPFRAPRPDSDTELLFRNQAILHAHRLGYRLCQHLSTTVGWKHRENMD